MHEDDNCILRPKPRTRRLVRKNVLERDIICKILLSQIVNSEPDPIINEKSENLSLFFLQISCK